MALNLEVSLSRKSITVSTLVSFACCHSQTVSIDCDLQPAKNPEKTFEGVKKAFSKLGETDYRLGQLKLNDPGKLFAPMSVLNDLRRDLVEKLDEAREKARREKVGSAIADDSVGCDLSSEHRGIGASDQLWWEDPLFVNWGQGTTAGSWWRGTLRRRRRSCAGTVRSSGG